jgi:sulfofructose kinase
MGLQTRYVGVTGGDENGRRMRQELGDRGVDLTSVVIRDGSNPSAVIIVDDQSGDRIVLWERQKAHDLEPAELRPEVILSGRILHVDDVDPRSSIAAALMARAAGIPVTSDIDALNDRTEELIAAVSIPILAAHIPVELTGERDMETALRKLRRHHAGPLCVTLGRDGAVLLSGDEFYREPAFPVEVVDTTGAGDVFRGAYICAWLDRLAPAATLQFANAAAGLSCTRAGAINGAPTREETLRFLEARLANTQS